MPSETFIDRVERLSRVQIEERRKQLSVSISRIIEEMVAKNALRSGATITKVTSVCAREIENVGLLVWANIKRVHQTLNLPYSEDFRADFKEIIQQYVSRAMLDMIPIVAQKSEQAGSNSPPFDALDKAENSIIETLDVEVDLYVDSLRQMKLARDEGSSTTLNITGNVGVVQTGLNAFANVAQVFNEQYNQELIQVLTDVRDSLDNLRAAEAPGKEDMLDIIKDTVDELRKQKPNRSKILSLINTIVSFTATVSAMSSVYQQLKTILTPLGIPLP